MAKRKRDDDYDSLNSTEVELDTPEPQQSDNNNDDLKTHYYLQPNTTDTSSFQQVFRNLADQSTEFPVDTTPFMSLFDGSELPENVNFRFKLYNQVWSHQLSKIQCILNNANDDLFQDLVKFINQQSLQRLSVGYVQLTSNTANNLRILQEFYQYLQQRDNYDYKIIILNSKNFTYNIKSILREVVKQFNESCGTKSSNSSRINYDLDNIVDWFDEMKLRKTKVVLVLEDTNLINNQLLNQLLKVLQSYVGRIPFKILMALSCDTVSSWINVNIANDLRMSIEGYKFKSNDNKSLGYIILNNLFLTPELTEDNPLLINNTLSTIILNRFENSNNSIDALISEIKLCYMIYFYQSPLSILIAQDPSSKLYIDGLRKLSSFKKYIELRIHQGDARVKDLLTQDEAVIKLFQQARRDFAKFKLVIMNAINIIYQLHPNKPKQKFELYKLLINHKLLNSKYLYHSVKDMAKLPEDVLGRVIFGLTENCKEVVGDLKDDHLIKFIQSLADLNDLKEVGAKIESYFDNSILTTPLEYMVFHEIFSMNGGIIKERHSRPPLFEENYENLMINLLRPNLRATLEQGLDGYEVYLKNPLITNKIEQPVQVPILNHLFKLYKEAPSSINIHDFYLAFKATLSEEEYSVPGQDWDKLTFAWFVQSCHELMLMGVLQQKPKGDYLEKAIWKGV
ncbi:Orc3 Origin recognition complex subunit 3 [Candida maltosa Xu316]